MYAGIRVILCFSVRLNIWQASLERKGELYHLDYTDKLLQCCYPNAKETTLPDQWKAILHSTMAMSEPPARQYKPYI